jgi:cytochrome b6-f complex iron-sulfur subunit
MAEKKKMSVAEILAAARKADSGGAAAEKPAEPAADTAAEEATAPAETPAVEKPKPAAKPAAGGARPSVAEMMAIARANKPAASAAPAEAKPAAKKEAPAKPAKAAPHADATAKEKEAAPVAGGPKDTASILAAARGAKPGPISKEAAAKLAIERPAPGAAEKGAGTKGKAEVKAKPTVPPMPAKPDYAKPKAATGAAAEEDRRGFIGFMVGTAVGLGFSALSATAALWTLGTARFMFPNILTEPPSQFKVGFPADFPPGSVSEKFKAQYGVWVVNYEYNGKPQLFALRTVCTHLGCTPNWLEGEQKFKCPCHGSGFYKDGINFEGPAPRPLERYAVRLADDGQLEIDKSKLFQEELGQWVDPASFVQV